MDVKDEALLRRSALRTWRLFREFSTLAENWLIPDIVQEPASLIVEAVVLKLRVPPREAAGAGRGEGTFRPALSHWPGVFSVEGTCPQNW